MKEVIRIDKEEKPIEFTHVHTTGAGWGRVRSPYIAGIEKVVYLGHCNIDGDMFACYSHGDINIYKGHLNSGKY